MEQTIDASPKNSEDFMDNKAKRVLLLPSNFVSLPKDGLGSNKLSIEFIRFPHPATGTSALWCFDTVLGQVYQLYQLEEKCRSWFVGNYVLEDGSCCCLVPIDPIFLVIPFLLRTKQKKIFQPLNEILTLGAEVDFQKGIDLLIDHETAFFKDIDLICHKKVIAGTTFVKLSRKKLSAWLKAKTQNLAAALAAENINTGTKVLAPGYISNAKKENASSNDASQKFAYGMISEFLPSSLSKEIGKVLELEDNQANIISFDGTKKRKQGDPVEASEDYSKGIKAAVIEPAKKLTPAQKRLQKVDKTGMKSLANYFLKSDG